MTSAAPAPRWPAGCTRCCGLVVGGVAGHVTAGRAAQIVGAVTPDAVSAARCELAAAFVGDLRRTGAQLRETKGKLAAAVQASGTSLTGLFGIGPVTAATVIGNVRHVGRFASRDAFAAWNGTAPIEVSSGQRKVHRLSRRGNRRPGHAIHMAAVTQVSCRRSRGRACYDKKLAEGKTPKEALRALKRQVSDAIYAALLADARRAAARTAPGGPGRATGDGSAASAAGSHPRAPALRAGHSRTRHQPTTGAVTAGDPASAPFPAQLPMPVRAGRPGQGPGAARPRSGARRASQARQPASR